MLRSFPPSLSFAMELVRAILPLSALHTRALLPTSSNILIGPLHQHLFNVSWAHKPHINSCLIAENQCVPIRPFFSQITGLTHHCLWRSSHLSPHLNCLNFASSTLFLVHAAIFRSNLLLPSTEWPRWEVPPLLQSHMLP